MRVEDARRSEGGVRRIGGAWYREVTGAARIGGRFSENRGSRREEGHHALAFIRTVLMRRSRGARAARYPVPYVNGVRHDCLSDCDQYALSLIHI